MQEGVVLKEAVAMAGWAPQVVSAAGVVLGCMVAVAAVRAEAATVAAGEWEVEHAEAAAAPAVVSAAVLAQEAMRAVALVVVALVVAPAAATMVEQTAGVMALKAVCMLVALSVVLWEVVLLVVRRVRRARLCSDERPAAENQMHWHHFRGGALPLVAISRAARSRAPLRAPLRRAPLWRF